MPTDDEASTGVKRELDSADEQPESPSKRIKSDADDSDAGAGDGGDKDNANFVQPGTVGVTTINDNDVLSG